MAKSTMKSPLLLLGVAVGAYLLFRPKTAAAQSPSSPGPVWSPIDFTPATSTSARYDTEVQVPYRR